MPLVKGTVSGTNPMLTLRPGVQVGQEFLAGGPDLRIMATRSGEFLVNLDPGEYQWLDQGVPVWRIVVPDGSATYALTNLVVEAYARPRRNLLDALWDYVAKAGSSMTGPLILHADPEEEGNSLQAATRGYVDRIGSRFTHLQSSPATEWLVVHNMGHNPSVTVTDLAGDVMDPKIVFDPNHNQLTIYCNAAETGYAYLN